MDAPSTATKIHERISGDSGDEPSEAYGGEDMPIAGYAGLLGAYATLFGGSLFLAINARNIPQRLSMGDVVLLGIATHKLSRIITKDWVTIPLRAPFTRYEKSLPGGEVLEESRGTGMRRALGDLLTCQFCIGPWVAGGLAAGLVAAPAATRLVAATFTAVTVSDFLHHGYEMLKASKE